MIHVHVSTIFRRLLLVVCVMVAPPPLCGQSPMAERARNWPVDSVLLHFERDASARVRNSAATGSATEIIYLPRAYTARQDSLVDGLERLALTSHNANVRSEAVALIAFAGTGGRTAPPLPGIIPRLARIYPAWPGDIVQLHIRNSMPEQAERRAAAAFLRTLAIAPDPGNGGMGPHGYFAVGDPRAEALSRLAEMGAEGRAVLQAIHRSGEARSPQARAILARMAQRGFPVIDARRREQ
jgi:hypothetical protein